MRVPPVCVYQCAYVCITVCVYVGYVLLYAWICVYVCVYYDVRVYCVCARGACVRLADCVYVFMGVCIDVCMPVCMCVRPWQSPLHVCMCV